MTEPRGAERERLTNLCHARARNTLRKIYKEQYRVIYMEELKKVGITLRETGSTAEVHRLVQEA